MRYTTRPISDCCLVVRIPHVELDSDDYHAWWNTGRKVAADRRGRPNPRMVSSEWQLWRCNNTECPAEAIVYEPWIANAINVFGTQS